MMIKSKTARSKIAKLLSVVLMIGLIAIPFFSIYYQQKQAQALGEIQFNFAFLACTSCTLAFPANVAQNNYLVVDVIGGASGPSNVTDTLGNTFTLIVSDNAQYFVSIWIAKENAVGGPDTVSVNYGSAQSEVAISISEIDQLSSTTASVTSKGSGTTANPISVSSVTPNANDMCFGAFGVGSTLSITPEALTNNPMGVNFYGQAALNANNYAGGLLGVFPTSMASTFQISFLRSNSVTNTGSQIVSLVKWDYVLACFPSSVATATVTSTTSVPTTTTTFTSVSTTVTTTATGTIFPEAANTTDIWILVIGLLSMVFLLFLEMWQARLWPAGLLGGVIGILLAQQIVTSPTIIYGSTSFVAGTAIFGIITLVVIAEFLVALYSAIKRR